MYKLNRLQTMQLRLKFSIESPFKQPKKSYEYKKNTDPSTEKNYTNIYIPKNSLLYTLPYHIRNKEPHSLRRYRLLKLYMKNLVYGRTPINSVENLRKAQAIFLDENKLKEFMHFLSDNSSIKPISVNDQNYKANIKKTRDDNIKYVIDFFFKKEHPFYVKGKEYIIDDVSYHPQLCKPPQHPLLSKNDLTNNEFIRFKNKYIDDYIYKVLHSSAYPPSKAEARRLAEKSFNNLTPKEMNSQIYYYNNYGHPNTAVRGTLGASRRDIIIRHKKQDDTYITCNIKIKLKLKKTERKLFTLKQIKNYLTSYPKRCRTKKKKLKDLWRDLCNEKDLNNTSSMWNEMCKCNHCIRCNEIISSFKQNKDRTKCIKWLTIEGDNCDKCEYN